MLNLRALALLAIFLAEPSYGFYQMELIARSGEFSSFGLNAPSILYNSDPVIDDVGRVSFSYLGLDESNGNFHRRYWVKEPHKKGLVIYQAQPQNMLSRPELNTQGELLFTEFNENQTENVFIYRPLTNELDQAFSPKDYPDALGFTGMSFIGEDEFVWRELNFMGGRSVNSTNASWKDLIVEAESDTSYIFVPHTSGQYMAAKLRYGDERQWGENRPDQIIRWKLPKRLPEVVVEDQDANPRSPYKSFHNNLGLNTRGDVVFVASMVDALMGKTVVLKTRTQTYKVAREGEDDISEIETFRPLVNDQNVVVFRAKDRRGKRSIYAWSVDQGLKKIVGESDIVPSDIQTSRILDSDWGPGLAGSPWINNQNQIVFQAVLESKRGETRLGSAIYKVNLLWPQN